ncbi:nuclear transport factor 2 family protein [Solihabitans fulvus]|nr:nuclear transport factor 2 family protein [Solihabitans fulvus]
MIDVRASTLQAAHQLMTRFGAHDAPGVARLFAETVQWRSPAIEGAPWPNSVRTRREVEGYFWALFDTLHLETFGVQRVHLDGADAVVLAVARYRVPSTGREFSQHLALVLTVNHGEIHRFSLYQDTLAVADGLGLVSASAGRASPA